MPISSSTNPHTEVKVYEPGFGRGMTKFPSTTKAQEPQAYGSSYFHVGGGYGRFWCPTTISPFLRLSPNPVASVNASGDNPEEWSRWCYLGRYVGGQLGYVWKLGSVDGAEDS